MCTGPNGSGVRRAASLVICPNKTSETRKVMGSNGLVVHLAASIVFSSPMLFVSSKIASRT